MPTDEHAYTRDEDQFIWENYGKMPAAAIGEELGGLSRHQVRGRYLQLKKEFSRFLDGRPAEGLATGDEVTDEEREGTRFVQTTSPRIQTIEEAIAKAKVDTDVWEVERHLCNSWEVGAKLPDGRVAVTPLWQVKVWFRRRAPLDAERFYQEMIEQMRVHAPEYPDAQLARIGPLDEQHLLEVSVPDIHLGKLAWAEETGTDYDSESAEQEYLRAVEHLAARAEPWPIERILFVVGNDMLHVDSLDNTTTSGTPQDVDGRWQKSFCRARVMLAKAIDRLASIAPVTVLVVPGNHDRERMFYLGDTLASWYRKTARVAVDNSPRLRKYYCYGQTLLGFTHGNEEKHQELPLIMAQEEPRLWAETEHREWHVGHLHKRKLQRFTAGDTHTGVGVRILPSLSGTDAWHYRRGYIKGPRAAEAYLYNRATGYSGHFNYNAA